MLKRFYSINNQKAKVKTTTTNTIILKDGDFEIRQSTQSNVVKVRNRFKWFHFLLTPV